MSSRSDDSLDSLFRYEPSRVDAEARDDEPSVSTSRPQGPVPDEDINRAALKAEEEAFPFDLFEAKRELERLMASRGASTSGRGPRVKRQKPDPPGSTLCSLESLEALRHRFGISEAVEFVVPEKSDRADKPPENHFTLYEAFFGVILEYLWKHGISIGQIMLRGLRHMIGILVRSFECGHDIELNHLLNLLEIRKAPKGNKFYISNKAKRWVIGGFPSKDQFWTESFFYVSVNEASVGEDYVQRTKTAWGPLGSRPEALPRLGTVFCSVLSSPDSRRPLYCLRLYFGAEEKGRGARKKRPRDKLPRRLKSRPRRFQRKPRPSLNPTRRPGKETKWSEPQKATLLRRSREMQRPRWNWAKLFPRHQGTIQRCGAKPSNSAILALLKSTRPPTSVVQKHDPSRKRSAADKGKGVAVQKDEPSKKRRKPTPGDPAARKLVVDDPDASAVMFSHVNNTNTRLPPLEKLSRPRSYGAMAQPGTKFVAAINDLMAEYEADLSKVERRLAEARNETAASKAKLEEAQNKTAAAKEKLDESVARASKLEEEKIVLRANVDKAYRGQGRLVRCQGQAGEKEARRELTEKFQLAKVEEGLAKLEKAKNDENDLGQIKGNLAMIAVLKKPDAPTLDDEEAQLKSWESEYADDDVYELITSEIRGELVFSPVSPDSVDTSLGNEPLEETAANLSVVDPNGSNAGTPVFSNLLAERETQSAA
ncbi:uncharacterized protein At3g60930, chloroplastic-like [Eutrema salsugineum]|uniref:uncharacterized protein At3g60930, chloroplastic-like n=1 Tax=Eutrema salsugineum TaxID=72664 RepID=UPI000CED481C|nr:uncharacterized protein At3g60930, chloroplastic-like [Eutrema salsugineum]